MVGTARWWWVSRVRWWSSRCGSMRPVGRLRGWTGWRRRPPGRAAGRVDPAAGVMVQAAWLDAGPGRVGRLVIAVHHLVVDGVSWRIVVPDLQAGWPPGTRRLDPVPTSFRQWAGLRPGRPSVWPGRGVAGTGPPCWTARSAVGPGPGCGRRHGTTSLEWTLSGPAAAALVGRAPVLFHCGVDDVLLAGLVAAVAGRCGRGAVLVDVEGHGREAVTGICRGRWAGSPASTRSGCDRDRPVEGGGLLKLVKDQARAVPGDGLGYGLLRYLNPAAAPVLAGLAEPQVGFNYLGRFPAAAPTGPGAGWAIGGGAAPHAGSVMHLLEAAAVVRDAPEGPVLELTLSRAQPSMPTGPQLGQAWVDMLTGLAADPPSAATPPPISPSSTRPGRHRRTGATADER